MSNNLSFSFSSKDSSSIFSILTFGLLFKYSLVKLLISFNSFLFIIEIKSSSKKSKLLLLKESFDFIDFSSMLL